MEQLIELVRGKIKTKFDRTIISNAGQYNLKGNWLTGTPTLESATNFCHTIVKEVHEKNKGILKHTPYKVTTTSISVSIEHYEIVKGGFYIVCSFCSIHKLNAQKTTLNTF